jgi:hypothetical protein
MNTNPPSKASRSEAILPGQDLVFMYLPADCLQLLRVVDNRIKLLRRRKEEAIDEQDFEKAARFRDQEDKIRKCLVTALKEVFARIGLSPTEDDPNVA